MHAAINGVLHEQLGGAEKTGLILNDTKELPHSPFPGLWQGLVQLLSTAIAAWSLLQGPRITGKLGWKGPHESPSPALSLGESQAPEPCAALLQAELTTLGVRTGFAPQSHQYGLGSGVVVSFAAGARPLPGVS